MKQRFSILLLGLLLTPGAFASDSGGMYEVRITNVTRGQSFTPFLVATHRKGVKLFEAGQPASPELAALAEGGATAPLATKLASLPEVKDTTSTGGLLGPGQSVTVRLRMDDGFDHLSLAAMLVPTNDGFVTLNGVKGPRGQEVLEFEAPAYDAGSEPNDELCANIPGPVCGGEGGSPSADGEGYVHIHTGIHGIGNLVASDRDWRNPVAEISVRRVK
jgi:hypothetical protein